MFEARRTYTPRISPDFEKSGSVPTFRWRGPSFIPAGSRAIRRLSWTTLDRRKPLIESYWRIILRCSIPNYPALSQSLPLNGAGRLGGNVVNHPVNAPHFI